jgi:Ca2+-binding RTX toxin-like protein
MAYDWISPTGLKYSFVNGQIYVDGSALPVGITNTPNDITNYFTAFPNLNAASSIIAQNLVVNYSASAFDDIINFPINPLNSPFSARFNVDAGDGNDFISFGATSSASGFINGGNGNDTIEGSALSDTLLGGSGDDLINAYGGGDVIDGGSGNDTIAVYSTSVTVSNSITSQVGTASGGGGNDIVFGMGGTDYLFGDAGNDTIYGLNGNDVLNGGTGSDYLSGDAGNDSLFGGDGSDTLFGGAGTDDITGGAGADKFAFNATSDRDNILDFQIGIDRIRIDTGLASNFAALDTHTSFYNDGNWGIVEFDTGQIIALYQVDMTQVNASWFQFAIV